MNWRKMKIGAFLKRSKIPVEIENDEKYKRVTIRGKHRGVSLRDIEQGGKIGTKKQFTLREGQFILSKIDARYGAFGIAPPEVDGAVITGNFWAYDVDKERVNIEWFNQYTNSPVFYDLCERASSGITHRKYLDENFFLNHEIELPGINEQESVVRSIDEVRGSINQLSAELSHQLILVKELRQAYLREAMRGKLVAQDTADGPAELLLEKIKAEKEKLVAEKRIKRDKPRPSIKPEEIPFEIPPKWSWCRLCEISNSMSTGPFGTTLHQSDYVNEGVPLVNPMNIVNGKIVPSGKMMVNEETKKRLSSYELLEGDIVVARRGEMGRCAVVTENERGWLCGTGSFFIRLSSFINRDFFVWVFSSKYSKSYLSSLSVGSTMDNLNHRILNAYPFPLPPLAEQERIVAKLEKLMRACDALEANIRRGIADAERLLRMALKDALEPR